MIFGGDAAIQGDSRRWELRLKARRWGRSRSGRLSGRAVGQHHHVSDAFQEIKRELRPAGAELLIIPPAHQAENPPRLVQERLQGGLGSDQLRNAVEVEA